MLKEKSSKKSYLTVLLTILTLVILLAGGYFSWNYYQGKKQTSAPSSTKQQENQTLEEQPDQINTEENQQQIAPPENVVSSNLPSGWVQDKWTYENDSFHFSINHPNDYGITYMPINPGELVSFYIGPNDLQPYNSVLVNISNKATIPNNNFTCLDQDIYDSNSTCRQFDQTTFNGYAAIAEQVRSGSDNQSRYCNLKFKVENHYINVGFSGESSANICTPVGTVANILNSIKFY